MPLINKPKTTWADLLFGPQEEKPKSLADEIAAKRLNLLDAYGPVDTRRVYPQQYTYQPPTGRGLFEAIFPQGPEAVMGLAMPIAYHGTPHTFSNFDTKKIGAGQGAQSYGHGLYFAENPAVAKSYWEQLQPNGSTKLILESKTGTAGKLRVGTEGIAGRMMDSVLEPGEQVPIGTMKERLLSKYGPNDIDYRAFIQHLETEYKNVTSVKKTLEAGGLLKVNIKPPAEKFLDWDKPLSQQAPTVREAVGKILPKEHSGVGTPVQMGDGVWSLGNDLMIVYDTPNKTFTLTNTTGRNIYGGYSSLESAVKHANDLYPEPTGAKIYGLLGNGRSNDAAVSKKLNDLGIPGIRYLDQGSRQAGKGTYNYVVFNDKDVKILERK